jgi:hypothetical protein
MTLDAGQDILRTTMYVMQDTIPEDTETFYVFLRTPQGGAEIGVNNRIAVNILSNDNAHGIIEIAQVSGSFCLFLFFVCLFTLAVLMWMLLCLLKC